MNNNFLTGWELGNIGLKSFGRGVLISRNVEFINPKRISIGNNTRIDSFSVICAGPDGIKIGSNVHISTHVTIVGRGEVTIEDFVGLSSGVKIFSSSDDYSGEYLTNPCVPDKYKKTNHSHIYIGKHGVIGAGSVLLPGAWLGANCAVGALSLVNQRFNPGCIVAGIPAKFIKHRGNKILQLEYEYHKEWDNVDSLLKSN